MHPTCAWLAYVAIDKPIAEGVDLIAAVCVDRIEGGFDMLGVHCSGLLQSLGKLGWIGIGGLWIDPSLFLQHENVHGGRRDVLSEALARIVFLPRYADPIDIKAH